MLKHTRNIVSIILTIVMVLGVMPISAFADDSSPSLGISGEITSFAELDESVANQSYENIEQMNREFIEPPKTLTVTVRLSGDETASPGTTGDETASPGTTGGGTIEADIPVEWDMTSREETGEGGYIIRFNLAIGEEFTLAEGVMLPQITVTVGQMDTPEATTLVNTVNYTLHFKNGSHGWNLYKGNTVTDQVYNESVNSGKWYVEGETLVLDGFNFSTKAATALELPANSRIKLKTGYSIIRSIDDGNDSCGIYAAGNLTITGYDTASELRIYSTGESEAILRYGIHVKDGSLTVDKATVKALCEEGDGECAGIYIEGSGDLNITDGVVHASGGEGDDSFGLLLSAGNLNVTGKSIIRAFGGENAARVGSSVPMIGITITDEENNVPATFSGTPNKIVRIDNSDPVQDAKIIPANANIVLVEFESNGGIGQMPPVEVVKDAFYALSSGDFIRPAYRLEGWKVNNSGGTLPVGTTITMDDYKTLWAQWEPDGTVTNIAYGSPVTVDGVTFEVENSGEAARVIRVDYGTDVTLYVEGVSNDPPLITVTVTESAPADGVDIQFIYEISGRPKEESIEVGSKVILRAGSRASVSAGGNPIVAMENGVTVTLMDKLEIGSKHTEFRETEVGGGEFVLGGDLHVILKEGELHKYGNGAEFDLSSSSSKVMMSRIQQGFEGELFSFDNIDANNAAVVHASSDTGLVESDQKIRFAFNIR